MATFPTNGTLDRLLKYGAATAIALFLTWWLTKTVDNKLDTLSAIAVTNSSMIHEAQKDMGDFKIHQEQSIRELITLTRQICINVAGSREERNACSKDVK